jgi:hypothetical protein
LIDGDVNAQGMTSQPGGGSLKLSLPKGKRAAEPQPKADAQGLELPNADRVFLLRA